MTIAIQHGEENAIPSVPQTLKIAIAGGGTVGSEVYKVLQDPSGRNPRLSRVEVVSVGVRDIKRPRPIPEKLLTDNLEAIVNDSSIDIFIELIGGIEPARELIMKAIGNGKHVITANKALIAEHGDEISAWAAKKGVSVKYEAAVAGGIPILHTLKHSLGSNRLEAIIGILNGTTNYMLGMMSNGKDYPEALKVAQDLGYAEADPTADVSGRDAGQKLMILAKEMGHNIDPNVLDNPGAVKGTTSIESQDIQHARELDYTIKLLAICRNQPDGSVFFQVSPHLVSNKHPLASVKDAYNAVFVTGDPVGELLFHGKGAGAEPTASAVVADIVNTIEGISTGVPVISASSNGQPAKFATLSKEIESKFYLRLIASQDPIGFSGIMWFLGTTEIAPESVQQHITPDGLLEIVIITHPVSSQKLKHALTTIGTLPHLKKVANCLPVLEAR
jgi:homoserine dehydrogenase